MSAVEHRKLGSLDVSAVGLGCNSFGTTFFNTYLDLAGTRAVVDAAIDLGVTFFDTADVYGDSEEFLGNVLKGRRDRVVLATKFGRRLKGDIPYDGSPEWLEGAIEGSLQRLQTDYIDLYQLHYPDSRTPIAETLTVLDRLVSEGKIREIGCANFSSEQLVEASDTAKRLGLRAFVSAQSELNLLRSQACDTVIPTCMKLGLAFVPYSPLRGGLLTGKYRRSPTPPEGSRVANLSADAQDQYLSEEAFARIDFLTEFAADRGKTLLELAMAWLLSLPGIASVIAGARSPEQVQSNTAAGEWRLTELEVSELAQGSTG